ncbi:MAG: Holliday junction branch migration protein RuvA [Clostridia bacterium]|nr:Holliday junction branch migration protein RuvA [Clostridia bacterium]
MISFVRGTLFSKDENSVTIDVGGIGFKVQIPIRDSEKLRIGEEAFLNTYFAVREDAMDLYGFINKEDLSMFNKLITVSGVGPKAAINLLSAFTSGELGTAIVLSDSKKIATAQGIGAKTAQRIILELKDKISDETLTSGIVGGEEPAVNAAVDKEAVSALMALGYTASEAQSAIKKAGSKATVEETVKAALVALMRF